MKKLILLLNLFLSILNLSAQTFTQQSFSLKGLSQSATDWGDFDNDGDLDLLLSGYDGSNYFTQIYENINGSSFSLRTDIVLANLSNGTVNWIDFDNDNDLDIFITGYNGSYLSKLYENTGTGFNERTDFSFAGVSESSVAWGDFDNDGDKDLLLCGYSSGTTITKIYENRISSFVERADSVLEAIRRGVCKWADIDNDGDLDIFLSGWNGTTAISSIYENTGTGFSLRSDISIAKAYRSDAEFGDYDGDGDLDFILAGSDEVSSNVFTQIYENTGTGFTYHYQYSITGAEYAKVAFGDYDNDGDLDFLVSGSNYGTPISQIYLNVDTDFIEQTGISLQGVYLGDNAWGDYDSDGDLDLILMGSDGTNPITKIYRNDASLSNSVPVTPNATSEDVTGQDVKIYWAGASDAQTSATGLSYNLRIGNTSGGSQIMSPEALSTGTRKVAKMGNVQQNTNWTIKNLAPGTYYWSIQSIDNNFAGSTWSPERTFSIVPPPVYSVSTAFDNLPGFNYGDLAWGDADGDGDLDLMVTGQSNWGVKTYLIYNDNGAFTRLDSIHFAQTNYSKVRWLDYDNDGFMDIWLNGVDGTVYTGSLYRNTGAGNFTEISTPFQGMFNASADWGDYDSDGDLDLLIVGKTVSGAKAFIYRNNGGTFEERLPGFANLDYSTAKFGDYDADGDLDVILIGRDVNYNPQTYLYQNNGDYTWTDVTASKFVNLPVQVDNGDLAWLDFDADGLLDFVLTGKNSGGTGELNFYRMGGKFYVQQVENGLRYSSLDFGDYDNDGDMDMIASGLADDGTYKTLLYKRISGSYTLSSEIFQGVNYGTAKFGDYDNDGDLDIALLGKDNTGKFLKLYVNNTQNRDNPPAAPANLVSTVSADSVNLVWDSASDDSTASNALGYNIKVGTTSGSQNIVSPFPANYPQLGNSNINKFKKLFGLANGTYYWSIQAVDNGYKYGNWSAEQSFTIGTVAASTQDSLALVALYNSTDGANWSNNSNWLSGSLNTWYGVSLTGGRVTKLNLVSNNLNGYIPASIGNLTMISFLDLGSNILADTIPSEIGNLVSLDTLYLANSQLTGSIPSTIGNLTNLQVIALDKNRLIGSIPFEMGQLLKLSAIYLQENQLTGAIPSELSNLSSLQYLYLNNNQLSGGIPSLFGNLSSILHLVLYGNQLSGTIPYELGNLINLNHLDLDYNQLTGNIPWQLGNLTNLTQLFLDNNQLTGSIPIKIGNLTQLQYLFLNNNLLTGAVPAELNNLINLQYLYLNNNQLDQLNNLSALTSLGSLYIQNNKFDFGDLTTATLNWANISYHSYSPQAVRPITKDNLGTGYTNLSFTVYGVNNAITWFKGDNIISGEIDTLISVPDTSNAAFYAKITDANFPELNLYTQVVGFGNDGITNGIADAEYNALLDLYNSTNGASWANSTNWLTSSPVSNWYGIITEGIHINNIYLFNNNLSGTIPTTIDNFLDLQSLNLSLNNLTGSIPVEIGNLGKLQFLSLSRNQLSGNIPAEIGNISSLTNLYLYTNTLNSFIPIQIGNLTNLNTLYIYDNQLSGTIPLELGNLSKLTRLGLSDNQFTGSIPSELGNLSNLITLYLSNNQLTGEIPATLGNISGLTNVYLQNNQLSGVIPSIFGQLVNLVNCDLSNNRFSSIPQFSSTNLDVSEAKGLQSANNILSFESLEPNASNLQIASKYAPQKSIPLIKSDSVPVQAVAMNLDALQLTGRSSLGGANTYFQWYKDGIAIGSQSTNPVYSISSYNTSDSGYYYCEITNTVLSGLTLKTESIHLTDKISTLNAPSGLSLNVISSSQIDLSWTDNSNNEDGFYVYYSTDATNYYQMATLGSNSTFYSATQLESATIFYFRVCAFNTTDETCSATVSASTQGGTSAPAQPTNLTASATGGTTIDLSWTDNAINEDAYFINYSTDGLSFSRLANLAANKSSFTASGLIATTTYYFYVCATNSIGDACSNTVSATTLNANTPVTQNQEVCFGDAIPNLTAVGQNLQWYSDANLSNLLFSGSSFATGKTQVGIYTYYVTQTISGAESSPAIAKLIIRALPTANAGVDIQNCETRVPLNANLPANNSGEWTIVQGSGYFSDKNNNTASYFSDNTQNTVLFWTIIDSYGCSNSDDVNITFLEIPQAPIIKKKGQSIANFALFICETPNMQYQWYRDNLTINGATEQYYVERSNFGNTYGVEITAGNGCKNRTDVNYLKTSEMKVIVYPIPASETVIISVESDTEGELSMRISDSFGTICGKKVFSKLQFKENYSLNISTLKPGIYILEIIQDNQAKVYKKLIVQ